MELSHKLKDAVNKLQENIDFSKKLKHHCENVKQKLSNTVLQGSKLKKSLEKYSCHLLIFSHQLV